MTRSTGKSPAKTKKEFRSRTVAGALIAGVLCGPCGLQPVYGQASGRVTVDVGPCVDLESAAERLACFDARSDAVLEARGGSSSAEAAVPDAESDDPRADEPAATVPGRRARSLAEPQVTEAVRQSEAAGDEYLGTIAAVRERLPQSFIITLENGQVWQQTEPKRYPLRPGLEVRIYRSRWGDYRLSGADTGSFIRVQRVR